MPGERGPTLHQVYVRQHKRHFGTDTELVLGPDRPEIELLVRAVLAEHLDALAAQFHAYPGTISSNIVAMKLRQHANQVAGWSPMWSIAVDWEDGSHSEYPEKFTSFDEAHREAELIRKENTARKVEVYYR